MIIDCLEASYHIDAQCISASLVSTSVISGGGYGAFGWYPMISSVSSSESFSQMFSSSSALSGMLYCGLLGLNRGSFAADHVSTGGGWSATAGNSVNWKVEL